MMSNPLEKVVADREKFSLRLGVAPDFFDEVVKPLATGGACAAIGALAAAHIAGPATVIKILGLTLYASSGPVGWAVGAGVAAFAVGCSAHVLSNKISDRFGNVGTYRKDFDGNLSEIGRLVADTLFCPVIALAMSDWSDDKGEYILRQFKDWGYDENWSLGYLQNLRERDGDVLAPALEIVSSEGFGGRDIKDKTIEKGALLDRAIENLGDFASEFSGNQEIVREREEAICRRLKENFRD